MCTTIASVDFLLHISADRWYHLYLVILIGKKEFLNAVTICISLLLVVVKSFLCVCQPLEHVALIYLLTLLVSFCSLLVLICSPSLNTLHTYFCRMLCYIFCRPKTSLSTSPSRFYFCFENQY